MIDTLNEREVLVLYMLADGETLSAIQNELSRGNDTVKHIVAAIKWKLQAKNITHAVALAYHHGILVAKEVS